MLYAGVIFRSINAAASLKHLEKNKDDESDRKYSAALMLRPH